MNKPLTPEQELIAREATNNLRNLIAGVSARYFTNMEFVYSVISEAIARAEELKNAKDYKLAGEALAVAVRQLHSLEGTDPNSLDAALARWEELK